MFFLENLKLLVCKHHHIDAFHISSTQLLLNIRSWGSPRKEKNMQRKDIRRITHYMKNIC